MSVPDVALGVEPVLQFFEALNIPHYIGGSIASSIHGEPRSTLDADVVADLRLEHIAPMMEHLSSEYYMDATMMKDAIQHYSSFNLIHNKLFIKVDIFLPQARAFDTEAMQRRERTALGEEAGTPTGFVATAEDTVLKKLEWFRLGNEISDRQWRDILGVMKLQCFNLDFEYLEHWAREIQVDDLLQRALQDAGLKVE